MRPYTWFPSSFHSPVSPPVTCSFCSFCCCCMAASSSRGNFTLIYALWDDEQNKSWDERHKNLIFNLFSSNICVSKKCLWQFYIHKYHYALSKSLIYNISLQSSFEFCHVKKNKNKNMARSISHLGTLFQARLSQSSRLQLGARSWHFCTVPLWLVLKIKVSC